MIGANLALALVLATATPPDSASTSTSAASRDTTVRSTPRDSSEAARRVVRTLEEFTVRGARVEDALTTQTTRLITTDALRSLPVERLNELIGLQAGVVARGEDLHVRGGRAGESEVMVDGVTVDEPQRGRPLEVPVLAIREAELMSGGLDADVGGALAGVLALRTRDPREQWGGTLRWQSDGRMFTHYDHGSASIDGPIPGTGLGVIAVADATLDDTHMPALRTNGRTSVLGRSLGWRADNHLLGFGKIATRGVQSRFALETFVSRRVTEPFDPMWTLDGWTRPCADPDTCFRGPEFRSTDTPGFSRYRAADHLVMTDERRVMTMATWQRLHRSEHYDVTLAWAHDASVTSLNGQDDQSYTERPHAPYFGYLDSPTSQPFYVYLGDDPYFKRTQSDEWSLSARFRRETPRGDLVKLGAGVLYDEVQTYELDTSSFGTAADSLRAYHAWAPGGFAYAHSRWVFEGMSANVGGRLEYFTPGPQADQQSLGVPAHGFWTLSPRVGIAYPLSVHDVFSLSYVRVKQSPDRDFLYDNRRNVTNRQPIGNPALEPATLISYQAAVKHLLGNHWSLQAGLFYRDLYGLVGARNAKVRFPNAQMVYENADDAHALGYELSATRTAGEGGAVELHYTWLDARGTTSSEEGVPFGPRRLARPEALGQHDLDWDRRHSFSLIATWRRGPWSLGWTTAVGSPLPWTPSSVHTLESDLTLVNSARLGWEETSALTARCTVPVAGRHLTAGIDVHNVFDTENELSATADGYPNPFINTVYDDYGAYRAATGQSGGAYWNDVDGNGIPGWMPVHDPRLFAPPRSARAFVEVDW